MNTALRIFNVEWIKVRKRTIFYVAIIANAFVLLIGVGAQQYMHHRLPKNPGFSLPGDWGQVIDIGHSIGMLMMLVAVALLTASEATWRTQRQNVIDGLSRAHYFIGKLMVVVLVAIGLWAGIIIVALLAAPFGGSGSLQMPVFSALAVRMLPNLLFYFIAMGSAAFMFGMLASSSGAALGLMFAFVIIEPIIGQIMMKYGGTLEKMAQMLPLDTFGSLVSRGNYDPVAHARMADMFEKMGRPMPISLSTGMIMSLVYIAVFVGIAWMAFRTRDL